MQIQHTSLISVSSTGPCASNPCHGGSTCEEHDGTFTCFCADGRAGERCQIDGDDVVVGVPAFGGGSWVEMGVLDKVSEFLLLTDNTAYIFAIVDGFCIKMSI